MKIETKYKIAIFTNTLGYYFPTCLVQGAGRVGYGIVKGAFDALNILYSKALHRNSKKDIKAIKQDRYQVLRGLGEIIPFVGLFFKGTDPVRKEFRNDYIYYGTIDKSTGNPEGKGFLKNIKTGSILKGTFKDGKFIKGRRTYSCVNSKQEKTTIIEKGTFLQSSDDDYENLTLLNDSKTQKEEGKEESASKTITKTIDHEQFAKEFRLRVGKDLECTVFLSVEVCKTGVFSKDDELLKGVKEYKCKKVCGDMFVFKLEGDFSKGFTGKETYTYPSGKEVMFDYSPFERVKNIKIKYANENIYEEIEGNPFFTVHEYGLRYHLKLMKLQDKTSNYQKPKKEQKRNTKETSNIKTLEPSIDAQRVILLEKFGAIVEKSENEKIDHFFDLRGRSYFEVLEVEIVDNERYSQAFLKLEPAKREFKEIGFDFDTGDPHYIRPKTIEQIMNQT